jgi:methionyl-tRNA synthetase
VLFHAAESLRLIAAMVAPVAPKTAQTIWQQLGLDGKVTDAPLNELAWSESLAGRTVRGGASLFPRLDAKEVFRNIEIVSDRRADKPPALPSEKKEGPGAPPLAPTITIDDFAKVDLRVATILEAERVPGADKLLRLVVDLGFEKRQVLAGIASAYKPETLAGRKVVVVANLQPRKLRGLESNGMVVAASIGPDDKPVLIGFHEDIQDGARLK